MELTQEQQAMLEGENGPFYAKCMRWLVDLGEAMGAKRLIPVENTMPAYLTAPGHTLKGAGTQKQEDYIGFISDFLRYPVKCPSCSHIARFDLSNPSLMEVDAENVKAQKTLLAMAQDAGINMTWSCSPYLAGNVPLPHQICAWTESHAVVLINSFFAARTTRNSGETALAAAITGWIPEFGTLLDEGRKPELLIDVQVEPENDLDWGLLGYFAGKVANIRIPAFKGLKACRLEAAKQLCAGLAASGGATMLHIIGVTPEAPTQKAIFPNGEPEEIYVYGHKERSDLLEYYNAPKGSKISCVYFGCPHASIQEFIEISNLVKGKTIADDVELLISTNYGIKSYVERMGYAQIIEEAGGRIMCDSCALQAPYLDRFKAWKRMATNAVKQAHYARAILKCDTVLGTPERLINAAITGRWE